MCIVLCFRVFHSLVHQMMTCQAYQKVYVHHTPALQLDHMLTDFQNSFTCRQICSQVIMNYPTTLPTHCYTVL